MKKILISLFIFCAILFVTSAIAEEYPASYFSDFSSGLDGWYADDNSALSVTKNGTLKMKHNSERWCAVRDFDFVPGITYTISICVDSDHIPWDNFFFGVVYSQGNQEYYYDPGLYQAFPHEKWKTCNQTYIAKEYEHTKLYISLYENASKDLEIQSISVRPDCNTLIEGITDRKEYAAEKNDGLYGVESGDSFSNDNLNVQILNAQMYDDREIIEYIATPIKAGISEIGGHKWCVLPREEMPEELLGTWKFGFNEKNMKYDYYYTFNEDGTVGSCYSFTLSGTFELYRYAYSNNQIALNDGTWFDIRNGILYPRTNKELKKTPQKIQENKAKRIKSFVIEYPYVEKHKPSNPELLLIDPKHEYSQEMIARIQYKKAAPNNCVDRSLQLISDNPGILKIDNVYSNEIYLQALKPGTVEVSFQPKQGNGKQSNTLAFTVIEGERSVPENMLGVRWVLINGEETKSIIFNQNGQYFLITDSDNKNELSVQCGHYLYHDGDIQIGTDENGYCTIYRFGVQDFSGQTKLHAFCLTSIYGGYWECKPLQTGKCECRSGTFLFTEDGIPAKDNMSWDEQWVYYRSHNQKYSPRIR